MPAAFIGHGSPMNALEHNRYTEAWRALVTTPSLEAPRPLAQGQRAVRVESTHPSMRSHHE